MLYIFSTVYLYIRSEHFRPEDTHNGGTAFTKVDVTGYLRILERITGYSFPPEGTPFMGNRDRATLPGGICKRYYRD